MASIEVNGLLISKNAKTGLSINVDQCSPTKLCTQFCYRNWRTQADIDRNGWASTPNTGPITWRTQRESYKRNECVIKQLAADGRLAETAAIAAARCRGRGFAELRGNGTGDLFAELAELYAYFCAFGLPVYLFSRRPAQLQYLSELCDAFGLAAAARPFAIGSIDASTPEADASKLAVATAELNGAPALAYATMHAGERGCQEVDAHPAREHMRVVFGYHTNQIKTVVGHSLECPATAGRHVKCSDCRRCMRA